MRHISEDIYWDKPDREGEGVDDGKEVDAMDTEKYSNLKGDNLNEEKDGEK